MRKKWLHERSSGTSSIGNCIKRVVGPGGGGGVLPHKRLMGMCRWMGSHFHDWIDYNEVAFLVEVLEWGRTFSVFLR